MSKRYVGGTNKEWIEWLDLCDEMLLDEDYVFAEDTLQGIRDWIEKNEFITDGQKDAITNIRQSEKEW
jgi:hypothetical protein